MTPEAIECEVQSSLSRTVIDTITNDHTGWNEQLASVSEAIVKAEAAPKKDFATLQEETIEVLKQLDEVRKACPLTKKKE